MIAVEEFATTASKAIRFQTGTSYTVAVAWKTFDGSRSVREISVATGCTGGVGAREYCRSRAGKTGCLRGDAGQAVGIAREASNWIG